VIAAGRSAMALIAVVSCGACLGPEENMDKVVARAFDQTLRWSDLRQVIPLDATPKDSAALAQQYIDAWSHQQVVLHTATANQPDDDLDMEAQLEDYRRSLIIYNYEHALVAQKLDTNVSDGEIQAYYDAHGTDFELKDEMIRARWFKVNEPDKRVLRKLEQQFKSGAGEDLHELELWLARSGVGIVDRSNTWFPAAELRAEVPPTGVDELIMRNAKGVLAQEGATWFVEILEHRPRNSLSPLELVKQDIRAILLNQRKLQLTADMRRDMYEQAVKNNDVEILPQ
jgi:hypothetical protein